MVDLTTYDARRSCQALGMGSCATPKKQLSKSRIVLVQIPGIDVGQDGVATNFHAWAIVAAGYAPGPVDSAGGSAGGSANSAGDSVSSTSHSTIRSLFTAGGSIKGTLVLAQTQNGVTQVIAYLLMTEQLSGTYSVRTTEWGRFDIGLKPPFRSDVFSADPTLCLCGTVSLDEEIVVAF